jgi:hypothetical protein
MRRLVLAPALAALALIAPHVEAAPAAPQVTDPSGDANGLQTVNHAATRDKVLGAGNQDYADVVSVLWEATKTTSKVKGKTVTTVSGFKVTATLTGAPTPPAPTQVVYRMLSATPNCGFFGVVYYTKKSSDPGIPQSALRENCNDGVTRLYPIAMPTIVGNTITWTVPVSAIPASTKVKPGSKLADLFFQVSEIEDFGGPCLPDLSTAPAPVNAYSKACGLGAGVIDNSQPMGSFLLG